MVRLRALVEDLLTLSALLAVTWLALSIAVAVVFGRCIAQMRGGEQELGAPVDVLPPTSVVLPSPRTSSEPARESSPSR